MKWVEIEAWQTGEMKSFSEFLSLVLTVPFSGIKFTRRSALPEKVPFGVG